MTIWTGLLDPPSSFSGRVIRVGVCLAAVSLLLGLLVGLPTYRWAGSQGVWAMCAGLLISAASNWAGSIPVCLDSSGRSAKHLLGGMLFRVIVLVVLTSFVLWMNLLPMRPLLLWLAGGYFVLLMVETLLAAGWIRRAAGRGVTW